MITDQDKIEIAKILEELVGYAALDDKTKYHIQYHVAPEGAYALVEHKEIVTLDNLN